MKKILYRLWSGFLTWFGDIKIFKRPFFIVRDPDYFKMTGDKISQIMKMIRPGDIILRGFDNYLDGKFIPDKMKFSHGAVYVGDLRINGQIKHDRIIHAIAEGVSPIQLIEFCECDRIAIFRPKSGVRHALKTANMHLKNHTPYDFGFEKGVSALYCFELCGECYNGLDIPRQNVRKFFGLVNKKNVFLAESFFKSPDLECIFNYNPRFNIDFVKNN